MYLVSACLLGINCRYDNSSSLNRKLKNYLKKRSVLLICPEKLGGLPTPRYPAQISGTKSNQIYSGRDVWNKKACILNVKGNDVTYKFISGCLKADALLKKIKIKGVYLKKRSPSCGYGNTYNRNKKTNRTYRVRGNGVFAELLINKNIKIKPL